MTLEEYKQTLRERIKVAEGATSGPWFWEDDEMAGGPYLYEADGNTRRPCTAQEFASGDFFTDEKIIETDSGVYGPEERDRKFIAEAGSHYLADLKALLAAVEALDLMTIGSEMSLVAEFKGMIARTVLEKIVGEG